MLGRERLGERESAIEVLDGHEPANGPRLRRARHPGADRIEQLTRVGDSYHQRPRSVLPLGEQVEGDQLGIGSAVRDHDEVARPGKAVDPDLPEDLALGLLDVEVAGAHDDIDGSDRLGPVGKRGDRLRPTHPVYHRGAGEPAGGEDHRIDVTVGPGRRADGDLTHAGDVGGDGAHHDRRRVWGAATRGIHAGAVERDLAELDLVSRERHRPVGGQPRLGDLGDVRDRQLQARAQLPVEPLDGGVELGLRDAQRRRRGAVGVELTRVVAQRVVAGGAHSFDDLGDLSRDRFRRRDERPQLGREQPRIARQREPLRFHGSAPAARRSPGRAACGRPGWR